VSKPLRLAIALSHLQYYRHFDLAIRQLCDEGSTVRVVTNRYEKPNLTDRALQKAREEIPGISFERPLGRRDLWKYFIRPVRELINYSIYFRREHPSPNMARLWRPYFSKIAWAIISRPSVGRFLARDSVQATLRRLERAVPPSRLVIEWMRKFKPDVVVASPLVAARSTELEYIKAARALNIPSVYALASWDNLTTKGTIHVQPDLVFVWNRALLEEAVELHGVPRENIVITGAPTFDYWFEMQELGSRQAFLTKAGIDPGREYVVYLCTSRGMIEDEESLILDLASQFRKNALTRDLVLLVRPHPYNELKLERLTASNVRVYPRGGDWPDVEEAKRTYFDTLHYAKATVGINTSAMIESAIVDIPCVTIIDERYKSWQTEMGHFWHLMKGGFLDVQYSYDSAVNAIGAILRGHDPKCEPRRQFVRDFVRPYGLHRSASEIVALAIRMAAEHMSAAEIMQAIQSADPVLNSEPGQTTDAWGRGRPA
jgi:CDP-glycerol:poly(glycerophosphate) glycerophosphotransferase